MSLSSNPPANDASPRPAAEGASTDQLSGHEYDGILEYDNPMPRWWVRLFWISAYFAICYVLWLHLYQQGTPIQEEYAADMRTYREELMKKELGSGPTEESLEKLRANPVIMTDARTIFEKRCVQCHGPNGEGAIGPNLTDDAWLHGKGTLMDIYGVVNGGVAGKGMPEWGKQLPQVEIAKAAAYVGTLRGRHLPGKAPEGTVLTSTVTGK